MPIAEPRPDLTFPLSERNAESLETARRRSLEDIEFLCTLQEVELIPPEALDIPGVRENANLVKEKLAEIQRVAPQHIEHTRQMLRYLEVLLEQFAQGEGSSLAVTPEEAKLLRYFILCHDIGKANTEDPTISELTLAAYSYAGKVQEFDMQAGLEEVFASLKESAPERFRLTAVWPPELQAEELGGYLAQENSHPSLAGIRTMPEFWSRCHATLGEQFLAKSASRYGRLRDQAKANGSPDTDTLSFLYEREKLASRFAALHHLFDGVLPEEFHSAEQVHASLEAYFATVNTRPMNQMDSPEDNVAKMTAWVAIIVLIDKLQAGLARNEGGDKASDPLARYHDALDFIVKKVGTGSGLHEKTVGLAEQVRGNERFREGIGVKTEE